MYKALLAIFAFTICSATYSQTASTSANAKVYFIRSTGFQGFAAGYTVFIDDKVVCKLNNKRYSIHEVPPGLHRFSVQFAGKNSKVKAERIEIDMEAGKTYYIQLLSQTGVIKNNLYCQEVTKSSAQPILDKLTQDDCI